MEESSTLRLEGMVRGTWRLIKVVDRGGMGAIYRGHHLKLPIQVAVKVLLPSHHGRPGLRARFEREARIGALVQHPNLVRTLDMFSDDVHQYIVMDWLDGENVARRLARGPMPVHEAVFVALGAASGLAAAHAHGVIHRDMKPENVFLWKTPAGVMVPKVLDFGISLQSDGSRLTRDGLTVGTPPYMSPEQFISTRDVDARTDVYSLSLVLYEMIAGKNPFEEGDPAEIHERVLRMPLPPDPRIPDPLFAVICRASSKRPAQRYASMSEFRMEIERVYVEFYGCSPDPAGPPQREVEAVPVKRSRTTGRGPSGTITGGALAVQRTSTTAATPVAGGWSAAVAGVGAVLLSIVAFRAEGMGTQLRDGVGTIRPEMVVIPALIGVSVAGSGLLFLSRMRATRPSVNWVAVVLRLLLAYACGLGAVLIVCEGWAAVYGQITPQGERADVTRRVAYVVLVDYGLLWVSGAALAGVLLWSLRRGPPPEEGISEGRST